MQLCYQLHFFPIQKRKVSGLNNLYNYLSCKVLYYHVLKYKNHSSVMKCNEKPNETLCLLI